VAEAVVRLKVDATSANRALTGVQAKTQKLQSAFGGLRTAIAGIGIGLLAKQAVSTSANFEKLNVRLGLLTKASGTFAKSQQIAADAQKAFGLSATEALEGITDITARLAPLGVGVEDIKSTFFGFNTAAKLAGASTIEASNAFRQLAQALGSGRLAGDEFRSISEQIPTLLQPIADELNVPIGKLKELAAEGKLTSEVVLRALRTIETEGAASLEALVKADPTQVFKDLSNEAENLSRAVGDLLKPAVIEGTKVLTKLLVVLTEFVNSDAGQATLLLVGIAAAAKAIAVAVPVAGAAIAAITIKIGALKIAVLGLSGAIAATGIGALAVGLGLLTTQIIKTKKAQNELNDAIAKGSEEEVTKQLEKQKGLREKINERLETAKGRSKKALETKLKEIDADIRMLEGRNKTLQSDKLINEKLKERIDIQKESTEEIKNQQTETDKLKEKMAAVGEEIEGSIKRNLRDAITGAQSFGQAMTNVLNRIRDKIIDAQIDKFLGGFGENFGKSASGGRGKGIGGFLGGVLGGLFRENGGPVKAGQPYIVGERQPELFVPRRSGTIIPKVGGGGTVNNITINVDAAGSDTSGSTEQGGRQLGELIASVVQTTIINEQRSGGLLNP
jgi:tape measure domain-containing protein